MGSGETSQPRTDAGAVARTVTTSPIRINREGPYYDNDGDVLDGTPAAGPYGMLPVEVQVMPPSPTYTYVRVMTGPVTRPADFDVTDGRAEIPVILEPDKNLPCRYPLKWSGCRHHWAETRTLLVNKCGKLACPVCGLRQARKVARRGTKRLAAIADYYRAVERFAVGGLRHVAFSVRPDKYTRADVEADAGKALWSDFNRAFKRAAEWREHDDGSVCDSPRCRKTHTISRGARLAGGAVMLHLERKRHDDGTECERRRCKKHHVWIWGPHFHFLGYGWFQDFEAYNARPGGWQYFPIGDGQPRDTYDTLFYQVTHAALFIDQDGRQKGQVLHYVRDFGNASIKQTVEKGTAEPVPCPVCDRPQEYFYVGRTLGEKPDFADAIGIVQRRPEKITYAPTARALAKRRPAFKISRLDAPLPNKNQVKKLDKHKQKPSKN